MTPAIPDACHLLASSCVPGRGLPRLRLRTVVSKGYAYAATCGPRCPCACKLKHNTLSLLLHPTAMILLRSPWCPLSQAPQAPQA